MGNETPIEQMLTGGHPNSLGNTIAVTEMVLADRSRLEELYQCYFSSDEVVRLRVSSTMKRVCLERPDWIVPYIDKLLEDISKIDQASTQWTLAILFLLLQAGMSTEQKRKATAILQTNLIKSNDWIVQNNTIATLSAWAKTDPVLKNWLIPRLENLTSNKHKSVAARAKKCW